jgi:hypothetical protein
MDNRESFTCSESPKTDPLALPNEGFLFWIKQ